MYIYLFIYFYFYFIVIICYLDLSRIFSHGISIFFMNLSTWACLLGFAYFNLESKFLLCNGYVYSGSNRLRILGFLQ